MITPREDLDKDLQHIWTEPNFRKTQRFKWLRQHKSHGLALGMCFVLVCLIALVMLGALK